MGYQSRFHAGQAARLALALTLLAGGAAAQVPIGGNVSDSTTGPLLAGTVYHTTSSLTVPLGETLTVQPGAIVKFGFAQQVTVNGTLDVQGTAGSGVVFTSIADDTAGGDTNGDGPSSGVAGWWRGLRFVAGSGGTIDFATVAFAGQGGWAAMRLEGTSVLDVADTTLAECSVMGLDLTSSSANFGSTFTGCQFLNNGGRAVDNAPLGMVAGFSGCSAGGNALDTLAVTTTDFPAPALAITTDNAINDTLYFVASVSVPTASSLTFGPGVITKWAFATQVTVSGNLVVNGTPSEPVIFTDFRDDTHGGDTNNDAGASSPAPGWWRGLRFVAASTGDVDHAVVRYAGQGAWAALRAEGTPTLQVADTTLSECSVMGLDLAGDSGNIGMTVTDCSFLNNTGEAVRNVPVGAVPGFTENSASGNGLDTMLVSTSTFTSDVTIAPTNQINDVLYSIASLTVPVGRTLTLEAGVNLKFGFATQVIVSGTLLTNGTPSEPVVLTDFRDDAVAGDTNNDGTATLPAEAWWRGVRATSGCSVIANHARVRYAGQGGWAAFRCETGSSAELRNCRADFSLLAFELITFDVADRCVAFQNSSAGFQVFGGSGDLTHATAYGNGKGIRKANAAYAGEVLNSISWGNTLNYELWPAGQVRFSNGDAVLAGSDGNIDLDPIFSDAPNGVLTLRETSPCIDAGDPASPFDPDATIADMGAFFFDQCIPIPYCNGKTNSLGCIPFVATVGRASVSSTTPFRIEGRDHIPSESGLLLYSFKKSSLGFHGGTLCVKAPFTRTPAKAAKNTGGGTCPGVLSRNFNNTIQSGNDPALTVGKKVFVQWRQRDPLDPAGFGDNLTNGATFLICP